MIIVMSIMNGLQNDIRNKILMQVPHLIIKFEYPFPNWKLFVNNLIKNYEIIAGAPIHEINVMMFEKKIFIPIKLSGINPNEEYKVSNFKNINFKKLNITKYSIILSQKIANSLNLKLYDKITIIFPKTLKDSIQVNLKTFTIVGFVYNNIDFDIAFTNINCLEKIKSNSLRLKLQNPYNVKKIINFIKGDLKKEDLKYNKNITFIDWTKTQGSLFHALKMEKFLVNLFFLLIIIIAGFNIISTLIMIVTEKKSDIKIIKILGASKKQIIWIFIIQGIFIGLIGTIIGISFGILLTVQMTNIIKYMSFNVIENIPYELQLIDIIYIFITAMIISFISTIYPANRANNIVKT